MRCFTFLKRFITFTAGILSCAIANNVSAQSIHDHSRFHTTTESIAVGVGGDGDIRAQLSWQNTTDLDLHLNLPNSEGHLYYGNHIQSFNNGGAIAELDHDNVGFGVDAFPDLRVENIVVNGNDIPHGEYEFYVYNFQERNTSTPYNIVIKGDSGGELVVDNGVLNYRGDIAYYSINYNGTNISTGVEHQGGINGIDPSNLNAALYSDDFHYSGILGTRDTNQHTSLAAHRIHVPEIIGFQSEEYSRDYTLHLEDITLQTSVRDFDPEVVIENINTGAVNSLEFYYISESEFRVKQYTDTSPDGFFDYRISYITKEDIEPNVSDIFNDLSNIVQNNKIEYDTSNPYLYFTLDERGNATIHIRPNAPKSGLAALKVAFLYEFFSLAANADKLRRWGIPKTEVVALSPAILTRIKNGLNTLIENAYNEIYDTAGVASDQVSIIFDSNKTVSERLVAGGRTVYNIPLGALKVMYSGLLTGFPEGVFQPELKIISNEISELFEIGYDNLSQSQKDELFSLISNANNMISEHPEAKAAFELLAIAFEKFDKGQNLDEKIDFSEQISYVVQKSLNETSGGISVGEIRSNLRNPVDSPQNSSNVGNTGSQSNAAQTGVSARQSNPPNRGFETPDISTLQIRRNQIAGDRASDEIAALHPNSRREVVMQTSDGPRRIDVMTEDAGAIESKVGRTSATSNTMRQVNKDRELLENGSVTSVSWEFRRSAQTGRVGPTPRLQAELEAAGIEIRIID